jgi:hypothetical protein
VFFLFVKKEGKYKGSIFRREMDMAKKVVVVNCGPRKGWNTDTLLTYAAKGAEEAGAEIVKFDLYRLEKYSGCLSCFGSGNSPRHAS